MKDERYKQIMEDLGMPHSRSLLQALQQVANEVEQEIRAQFTPASEPVAWMYESISGARVLHTDCESVKFAADVMAAEDHPGAHKMTQLYTAEALQKEREASEAEVKELVEALRRVATSMRWPDEGQAWCYSLDEATHDTLHAVLAKHGSKS